MADELTYVIEGGWADHEWREAAANRNRDEVQELLFRSGPRDHPWGEHAVRLHRKDQPTLIFPNKEAKAAYEAANEPDTAQPKRAAAHHKAAPHPKADEPAKSAEPEAGMPVDPVRSEKIS